jgi:hypothetical protein
LRCFACPIFVAESFLFTLLLMFMSVFIEVVQIPPTHYANVRKMDGRSEGAG